MEEYNARRNQLSTMKIQISNIAIPNTRIRKDLGDISELCQSIAEVGLIEPIVVSEDFVLIAGWRRLCACKKLGHAEIEVKIMSLDSKIEVDENNMRKEFTVSERVEAARILEEREKTKARERQGARTDLAPTSAKNITDVIPEKREPVRALDVVAQKTGFGTGRTYEKAKTVIEKADPELVKRLDEGKISIHSAYIAMKKDEQSKARKEEAMKLEIPSNMITGNCLEHIPKMQVNSIDLLIIDPPYGIDFVSNQRKYENDITMPVSNDKEDLAMDLLSDALYYICPKMKEHSHVYVFCSWKNYAKAAEVVGRFFDVKNVLVWDKGDAPSLGDLSGNYGECYELVIFATKGNRQLMGKRIGNILRFSKVTESERDHSCQKPIGMIESLIEKSTVEGELVVDCFAGTGSTLLAAENLRRKWIGIELEAENVGKFIVKLDKQRKT